MNSSASLLIRAWLFVSCVPLAFTAPLLGQQCVGDCNNDGQIKINELVLGVSIAIDDAPLDECPSFDSNNDGKVAINELVRAVADALYGCGVTPPTRPPTATRTPTSKPTLTPTPDIPNISGTWREDQQSVASSTCPGEITNPVLREFVGVTPCNYQVSQNGTQITLVDCDGAGGVAEIDETGTIQSSIQDQATEDGCTVNLTATFSVDASRSPTTGEYMMQLSFSGSCPLSPCAMTITSRWTRLQ